MANVKVIPLIIIKEGLSIIKPYIIQSVWPDKFINIHAMEISLVDFVFQDLIVWGTKEQATKMPAMNPIISGLIIFILYH